MERTKHGEFNWVDLTAQDLKTQSAFYEALFGWQYTDVPLIQDMTYRLFQVDGHSVTGMFQLPPSVAAQGVPGGWNTYFRVDDVDAAATKAAGLGAHVISPAMDVPGQGRQATIQDPEGAHISFWKPAQTDDSTQYMLPGRYSWNELNTRDPGKAISFYSALLGWEIEQIMQDPSPYWQIKVDGEAEAGLTPMPSMVPSEVPAYWLVYFGAADAKATVARAVELGGKVLVPATEIPGMLVWGVLQDPAGAAFAVFQALRPAS